MNPELMEARAPKAQVEPGLRTEVRLAAMFALSVSRFHFQHGPNGREADMVDLISDLIIKGTFDSENNNETDTSLAFIVGVWGEGFRFNSKQGDPRLFNPKLSSDYPPFRINETPEDVLDKYVVGGLKIIEDSDNIDDFLEWFLDIHNSLESGIDSK